MSEVILVGNGLSALDGPMGPKIDAHDLVVRFNWFWLKGFEESVGTKVDVWFTNIHCRTRLDAHDFRLIWCHSWAWGFGCKTFKKLRADHPLVLKTKKDTLLEMGKFSGFTDFYTFSTGAIAVWTFLQHFQQVTLHGFDWANGGAREKHHYGDKQVKGGIHKVDKEMEFFARLHKEERIIKLT
jgi:hypothetical protein